MNTSSSSLPQQEFYKYGWVMVSPPTQYKATVFCISATSKMFSKMRLPSLATLFFYGAIALLATIAAMRLFIGFELLTCWLPVDLETRYSHVHLWFSGGEFYESRSSTYPPASYLILWPILGWLPFEAVRTLWTLLLVCALVWLARWCLKVYDGRSRAIQCFIVVVFLAMAGTGAAVGVGQLSPFLLLLVIAALSLLSSHESVGWRHRIVAVILMTAALVKPSVTAPFLWLALWRPARLNVGVGVVAAVIVSYAVLTLISLHFQHHGLNEISGWAATIGRNNAEISEGYANLRDWLASAGLKSWSHPASLLVFGCLGLWTYRYRHLDEWLLMGITGLVARMWTYHNTYDDTLMIFPVLALLRVALQSNKVLDFFPEITQEPAWMKTNVHQAQVLLGILLFTVVIPPHLMQNTPSVGAMVLHGFQSVVWLLTLAFLLSFVKRLSPAANSFRAAEEPMLQVQSLR